MGNEKVDLSIITKESIFRAMEEYDKNNDLCKNRKSKTLILFYKSKEYPHKCIVGRAYNIQKSKKGVLDHKFYGSNCEQNYCASKILKKLGFILYYDDK